MFSLSPMVLLQHARVFLGGFLESRNYKIQVVAQAARQMFSEGCHEEEERQMRKSYGHREESVIWHKCKCGLPTIVGSVAWELLQPARIRRGAWHHQSGGRGKMGRVWVVASTLPPTRTDVGVWPMKGLFNRPIFTDFYRFFGLSSFFLPSFFPSVLFTSFHPNTN